MRISDSFDTVSERLEKYASFKDHAPKYLSRGVELNPEDNVCTVKTTTPTELNGFTTPAGEGLDYKQWMYTHNLVTNDGDKFYARRICNFTSDGSANDSTDWGASGIWFDHNGFESVGSSTVYGAMVLCNGAVTGGNAPAQADTYAAQLGDLDASAGSGRNSTMTLRTTTNAGTVTYPRYADADIDNTGSSASDEDIVTWSYYWAINAFNTTSVDDITGGVIVDRATNATAASSAKLLTRFAFASPFEKTASDTLKVFVNHKFEGTQTTISD